MINKKTTARILFVTASSKKEAKRLASGLVEKRFAACVNLISPISSIFLWNQKVAHTKEVLMVIKSTEKQFGRIQKFIESNHSYKVPEIISLKIEKGNQSYLNWISDCVA